MSWQGLTARDLMKTDVVTVAANTPLTEVERVLAENRISGVPVTDSAGHLTGMVSMRDLIEFRAEDDGAPVHRRIEAPADTDEEPADAAYLTRDQPEATAADVMTAAVYGVDVTATLPEIAREMVQRQIHRVLVQDRGHHIGLISAFDLLERMAAD